MFPLVSHQIGPECEALPTVLTLVGLVVGMNPLVLDQGGANTETLPTLFALIRLLPGVDPPMPLQV